MPPLPCLARTGRAARAEPRSLPYTSSIVTRRPTIAAARCRLPRVMSFFGSRIRSTWVRLVLSSAAILFFEIFFFFMASASCHATTSLTACACASSKMPSSLRKSSRLEPICFLLIAPTPSGAFAPLSSPCPNRPRKPGQPFRCLIPSHTRGRDALPLHPRFPRDQLLGSRDQVALQHDANDVPVSLGNLACDVAANRRLTSVVFV